ncbi:MAG: aldo/keto reductase [Dehalococcoidia bacterium]|nr:MAG: aldo/keto reductase [Dehalococcoidia bacterium]
MARKITRKRFIIEGAAGIASIGLLSSMKLPAQKALFTPRKLGRSGIMVPPVCFGATRISEDALLQHAIEQGFTFLDTGRSYANGNNERMVGRVTNGARDKVIIQSKIRLDLKEVPSGINSKKGEGEINTVLSRRFDECLKALNTSYIDIMLYHDASDEKLLFHDSVMKFFESKKSEKIIGAHGFSTHPDCLHLPEKNNEVNFYDVIMLPFNHKGSYIHSLNKTYSEWDQDRMFNILKKAHDNKIGFIAMKTCSGGPYQKPGSDSPSFPAAVNWVLGHDFVSSAAVAMANVDEITEHLSAFTNPISL